LRRGGRRARRYIVPGVVPVWVSTGRWGPRRARVEQCVTLRAELVYDQMIRDKETFGPGSRATLTWTPYRSDKPWDIRAEILANSVWRCGRIFLRCPRCERRATRLYVPVVNVEPRCRRCWGLSYESQSWSYRPRAHFFGRLFGPVAYSTTIARRRERREAARTRQRARRDFLASQDRKWTP
jgi:hypothetical protein